MRLHRQPSELLVAVLISVVGATDALVGGAADLFVLFVAVAALCALGAVRTAHAREGFRLRTDLVRWLEVTAAEQGERPADLADRAIGTFRAGLVHDPSDGRDPRDVRAGGGR